MARRSNPIRGRVHLSTMLLASYHVEYLMAECRQIRLPILYWHFMKGKTVSGLNPQVDRSSNGVGSRTLVIREGDLVEFMLRWGDFISGVRVHSPTQDFDFRQSQLCNYVEDIHGMEPYRERFLEYWRR